MAACLRCCAIEFLTKFCLSIAQTDLKEISTDLKKDVTPQERQATLSNLTLLLRNTTNKGSDDLSSACMKQFHKANILDQILSSAKDFEAPNQQTAVRQD